MSAQTTQLESQSATWNSREKNPLIIAREIGYLKRLRSDFRGHYNRETDPRVQQGWGRLILSSSDLLFKLRDWRFIQRLETLEAQLTVIIDERKEKERGV